MFATFLSDLQMFFEDANINGLETVSSCMEDKLNIQKSSGLDGISPNILKMSATVIYESLTHIFNLSLCTGNFPLKLKLARVTPLYKSGDIADMNNKRPITSTS